jgi:hypothetical protein
MILSDLFYVLTQKQSLTHLIFSRLVLTGSPRFERFWQHEARRRRSSTGPKLAGNYSNNFA